MLLPPAVATHFEPRVAVFSASLVPSLFSFFYRFVLIGAGVVPILAQLCLNVGLFLSSYLSHSSAVCLDAACCVFLCSNTFYELVVWVRFLRVALVFVSGMAVVKVHSFDAFFSRLFLRRPCLFSGVVGNFSWFWVLSTVNCSAVSWP